MRYIRIIEDVGAQPEIIETGDPGKALEEDIEEEKEKPKKPSKKKSGNKKANKADDDENSSD